MALSREQPIIPVYDIKGNYAGSYGTGLGDANNPVAIQNRTKVTAQPYRILGNMFAEADLFKGLTLRTSFGGDITNSNDHAFSYPTMKTLKTRQ
jgi:hypothetical protein